MWYEPVSVNSPDEVAKIGGTISVDIHVLTTTGFSFFWHSHCDTTIVSAEFAIQLFEYVFPSAPQTGEYSREQPATFSSGELVVDLSISIFTGLEAWRYDEGME